MPAPIQNALNHCFVGVFGINMAEAELPPASYRSIEDVFTRRLKIGSRPIRSQFCSPADGFFARGGKILGGDLIQAKDLFYDLEDFLCRPEMAPSEASSFVTVYLAPHNYHRVHSPLGGTLRQATYVPGELWPVNKPFVRRMPRLFARNERVIFEIETEHGTANVVMVGAFNVGRMEIAALPGYVTNRAARQIPGVAGIETFAVNRKIHAGDELGTFMLGSTVVVVLDQGLTNRFPIVQIPENTPIMMGQSLITESSS